MSAYCSVCGHAGHTGAEPHCSMCRVHPARHKIGEEGTGTLAFHNLTNYLCCDHFREVVGDCEKLPTHGHGEEWPGVYAPWKPPRLYPREQVEEALKNAGIADSVDEDFRVVLWRVALRAPDEDDLLADLVTLYRDRK